MDDIFEKYESPIKLIQRQLDTQITEDVLKAVYEVGISVDKEELIKALKYDRDSYAKGYHAGYVNGITSTIV